MSIIIPRASSVVTDCVFIEKFQIVAAILGAVAVGILKRYFNFRRLANRLVVLDRGSNKSSFEWKNSHELVTLVFVISKFILLFL